MAASGDELVTLKNLIVELKDVVDWFELGQHLPGVQQADLDAIKYTYLLSRDLQGCKTDLFTVWLRVSPEPTWSTVVGALRDIRMEALANKLARKYGVMDPTQPVVQPDTSSGILGEPREAVREEDGREQTDSAQSPGVAAYDVKILLVVINETENDVVKKFLEQPHTNLTPAVTLGKFGGHKAALMHTNMGDGCSYPVRKLLQKRLKQVDKVIAIGVAGGANRGEDGQKLGDVLVSESIECGDTTKVGKEVTFSRGRCIPTPDKLGDIFCKGRKEWSGKEFLCESPSRYSKVHAGMVFSASILWNNKDQKDKLLAAYPDRKFIGMEMEGKALLEVADEVEDSERNSPGGSKRKIAVIVIKGVCDYGDGTKEKSWQPVAAEAAARYAEFKLQKFPASDGQ